MFCFFNLYLDGCRFRIKFFIRFRPVDDGGDGEPDEDDATDDGDGSNADLFRDQRSGQDGEAGAESVTENAAENDSGDVVDRREHDGRQL